MKKKIQRRHRMMRRKLNRGISNKKVAIKLSNSSRGVFFQSVISMKRRTNKQK